MKVNTMPADQTPRDPIQYAHTRAATMLHAGLQNAKLQGRSIRKIAKELDYKQATVLSHMSNGRMLVPLDKAAKIARAVGIDPAQFLRAAVEQRVPEASELLGGSAPEVEESGLTMEIAMIAGVSLDQLNQEQQAVIREVAADTRPRRRWLTISELSAVLLLRQLRPELGEHGLSPADADAVRAALSG